MLRRGFVGIIKKLINQQTSLSRNFDKAFLPEKFLVDGNQDFIKNLLPRMLEKIPQGQTVYDVGCGKNPAISTEIKQKLQAKVIGVDLSASELLRAPAGQLDDWVEADICSYRGKEDGDLLLCQAVLEHVPDVDAAFASMSSMLRKNGVAMIFVPSRNALFARLNIILPQRVKLFLLHGIYPASRRDQGFPSYYNRCTPSDFRLLAARHGFAVEEVRTYYVSSYFGFFFPLYLFWRLWVLLFEKVNSEQAAETFYMLLRRI